MCRLTDTHCGGMSTQTGIKFHYKEASTRKVINLELVRTVFYNYNNNNNMTLSKRKKF